MKLNVLLADSDRDFLLSFKRYLELSECSADTVFDGTQVITKLARQRYDMVIVNRNIPRVKCREIVKMLNDEQIPVIVITDKKINAAMLIDEVLANSYLSLPFLPAELVELMRKIMQKKNSKEKYRCGGTEADVSAFKLGGSVRLTNEELEIIKALISKGEVNNKRAGPYINSLNNKFEKFNKNSPRIKYIMNEGYRLVTDNE